MKTLEKKLLLLMVVLLLLATFLMMSSERQLNWAPTFASGHDDPFGASLIFDVLKNRNPEQVSTINIPITDFDRIRLDSKNHSWLLIDLSYDPEEIEIARLMHRVGEGMTAIIAARPDSRLRDTLGISYRYNYDAPLVSSFTKNPEITTQDTIFFTHFSGDYFSSEALMPGYFEFDEESGFYTLAKFQGRPFFVKKKIGDGEIYLLANPHLLSNYHAWNKKSEQTTAAIISHFPPKPLLWNEYNKGAILNQGSSLSVMLQFAPLKAAYFTMLLAAFLFMIFRSKRKQRSVPEIPPPNNATKSHQETVSRLYRERDQNLRVIDKRIRYLANRLGLDQPVKEPDVLKKTARKYELDYQQLQKIMNAYLLPLKNDHELMAMNEKIEQILHTKLHKYG